MFAYRDAAGWYIEAVEVEGNVGAYACLSLDAEGNPHISYHNATDGDLKYARRIGVSTDYFMTSASHIVSLHVWPNPVRNAVHAKCAMPDHHGKMTLDLFDICGRRVARIDCSKSASANRRIAVFQVPSSVPNGQYFVKLKLHKMAECVPITILR